MKLQDHRQGSLPFEEEPDAAGPAVVGAHDVSDGKALEDLGAAPVVALGARADADPDAPGAGQMPARVLAPVRALPAPAPARGGKPESAPTPAVRCMSPLPVNGGAPAIRWACARAEWILLAAAVVLLGIGIAHVPLLDPDEARYASASRSMLERGDLV